MQNNRNLLLNKYSYIIQIEFKMYNLSSISTDPRNALYQGQATPVYRDAAF